MILLSHLFILMYSFKTEPDGVEIAEEFSQSYIIFFKLEK
jgi:hypothetical protein